MFIIRWTNNETTKYLFMHHSLSVHHSPSTLTVYIEANQTSNSRIHVFWRQIQAIFAGFQKGVTSKINRLDILKWSIVAKNLTKHVIIHRKHPVKRIWWLANATSFYLISKFRKLFFGTPGITEDRKVTQWI